jgi:hypothetical protein
LRPLVTTEEKRRQVAALQMAVNLTIAANQVAAILNAIDPTQYTSSSVSLVTLLNDTERRAVYELYDAIASADGDVCTLICQTPGHGHRKDFFASSNGVAHMSQLNSRIGPIESVVFVMSGGTRNASRPAQEFDKIEIDYEIVNAEGLVLIDPHYWIEGHTIYHNGAALAAINGGSVSVNVTYCAYTRSVAQPPVLQAPDEMTNAVVCRSVCLVLAKEGHHNEAAAFYLQMWQTYERMITGGQTSLMSLPTLANERAPQAQAPAVPAPQ